MAKDMICPDVERKLGRAIRDVRLLYIPFKTTLNPGESKVIVRDIPPSYAYRLEAITYSSDRDFLISIRDVGVNDSLMMEPVNITHVAGTGMMPAFLPCPYIFLPNSSIEMTVIDTGTAGTNNIEVVFWGYKLLL